MDLNIAFSPFARNGQLRKELAELLALFGINPALPLPALVEETMGRWVTKGHERWEEPAITLDSRTKQAAFWLLLGRLPLYHEIMPAVATFDHLLLLGGTLKPQDRKNALAVRLWNMGVRFDRIAHLGGDRVLDPEMDALELLNATLPGGLPPTKLWQGVQGNVPLTEMDMIRTLWWRSAIPPAMEMVMTQFFGATSTVSRRAHTGDTYERWLHSNPTLGRVLVMSISPHAPFQYWEAMRALGRHGFEIHMAAPSAALGSQQVSYFTGAIARWLRSYNRTVNG